MPSASTNLPSSSRSVEPKVHPATAINLGGTHRETEPHVENGAANQLAVGHRINGAYSRAADGNKLAGSHRSSDIPRHGAPGNHDALLLVLADALDDLERVRIATENRLRSLIQIKGLDDSREARTMRNVTDTLAALERKATLDLQRAMRAHPLGPWVAKTNGVGEKQAARLLATIGDPADRKMVSQLWQFCGHGAPSHRQRGVKCWWNPKAKMRVHLVAESCMKQRTSPYRAVYDDARMDWASRDTSDGHKHAHALRMVGKALLLDLWLEAHRLRGESESLPEAI